MINDYNIMQPFDTTISELPAELINLCEKIAKNVHDVWVDGRSKEGWTYGLERSDIKRTHPYLIPYEELPESEKGIDRNTAVEIVRLIYKLGFKTSVTRSVVQEWEEGEGKIEKIAECINSDEHSIVPIVGMEAFYVQNDNQETLQEYVVREIILRYVSDDMKSKVYTICKRGDIKSVTKLRNALEEYGNEKYKVGGFNHCSLDIYQCIFNVIKDIQNKIDVNPQVKDFLLYGKFPLIITTCYVNVLPKLIMGPNGKGYTSVNYFGYKSGGDLKSSEFISEPTIYNIFGEIKTNSEPMIDEDDFLKYLHCLHDSSRQPSNLKNYLANKQLFILGCDIPDWTFRFMLHSLIEKEGRIPEPEKRRISFRGGAIKPIIEDDLADFLSEIKYIYGNNVSKILEQINTKIARQKVFISYSAQQGTPVWTWIETFRNKLEPSSIVWFFPEQSKGTYGERYWNLIQKGVEQCDIFIPIITERVLSILEATTIGGDGPVKDSDPGFVCEWAMFLESRRNDRQVRCIPYLMEGTIIRLRDIIGNSGKKLSFLRPLFDGAQYISGDPANFDPENIDELGGTLLNI